MERCFFLSESFIFLRTSVYQRVNLDLTPLYDKIGMPF